MFHGIARDNFNSRFVLKSLFSNGGYSAYRQSQVAVNHDFSCLPLDKYLEKFRA